MLSAAMALFVIVRLCLFVCVYLYTSNAECNDAQRSPIYKCIYVSVCIYIYTCRLVYMGAHTPRA
jgi:hypothetical protein